MVTFFLWFSRKNPKPICWGYQWKWWGQNKCRSNSRWEEVCQNLRKKREFPWGPMQKNWKIIVSYDRNRLEIRWFNLKKIDILNMGVQFFSRKALYTNLILNCSNFFWFKCGNLAVNTKFWPYLSMLTWSISHLFHYVMLHLSTF